jgi:hypothetical protein
MRKIKTILGVLGAVIVPALAIAAGLYTNGMPIIGASSLLGVAQTAPNGVVTAIPPVTGNAVNYLSWPMAPNPLIPVDTNRAGGGAPQTVAANPFQIAAVYAESEANTTTSTAHNAVLNTTGALVTTESLSTAAGSTYSFTWTNSTFTTASTCPYAVMFNKSNTAAGVMSYTSCTMASGVATLVFTNVGTAALSGTMMMVLHV